MRAPYGAVKEACSMADGIGLTAKELAKATNLPVSSIRSCCRDYGFALRPERRELGSVKAIVEAAISEGMTIPQLEESSGIPRHTLYSAARRLGLTPPKARQAPKRP
jgi:hypothetical protein